MTRCPRCFIGLDPDKRLYECVGPCKPVDDPVGSAFLGRPTTGFLMEKRERQGERRWQAPPTINCRACGKTASEVCPTCHYRLPADWRDGHATCIALAGAVATGKSVYVGVAVKQLEHMLVKMGFVLSFPDQQSEENYRRVYEFQLYSVRKIMQSTTKVADTPDVGAYQSTPTIISLGVLGGVPRYLVFRDAAGEDLEHPAADTRYLSYVQHADAVFFMFDPTSVPNVREMLRGLIPEPLRQPGNPQQVLGNLIKIIGSASPPIAMILSKFDTLQELRDHEDRTWNTIMANPGAAFQRDPGIFEPRYNPDDGRLLHLEVRSLLEILGAQGIVNTISNPPRGQGFVHQYFAVSALGGSPDGEELHAHGIAPFRCLDPIRWVLARQNILPTVPPS